MHLLLGEHGVRFAEPWRFRRTCFCMSLRQRLLRQEGLERALTFESEVC